MELPAQGTKGILVNMHLNDLAKKVKQGTENADLVGLIFNTIGVSDGISMGTPGMRYSLPSRDIIADSMETVVEGMSLMTDSLLSWGVIKICRVH